MVNSSDRSEKCLRPRHELKNHFYFYLTDCVQREALGTLVSLEMGKIKTEGVGEVQEFVDIVSTFLRFLTIDGFDIENSVIMP